MKNYQFITAVLCLSAVMMGSGVLAENETLIGGDMGTYRVHSTDGAKVYFDSDYKGVIKEGILDVPVYITGTPYRSFTLEKEGYKTYTGPINSVPAKGQVVHIYATMHAYPVTEYATIHFLVTPTLSTVYLDGKSQGEVPPTGILIVRDVLPGNHAIEVGKSGYVTYTAEIYIPKNQIVKVPVVLSPAGSSSAQETPDILTVTASPPPTRATAGLVAPLGAIAIFAIIALFRRD